MFKIKYLNILKNILLNDIDMCHKEQNTTGKATITITIIIITMIRKIGYYYIDRKEKI